MKYDYIIAGSGCAGLSLLYKILQDPSLQTKKIMIIDREQKINNDRTWCFWEQAPGHFESIVRHQWENLIFKTEEFKNEFQLSDYVYKMIRGLDFYNFVLEFAANFENVDFEFADILKFEVEKDHAVLVTDSATFKADYIFNSTSLLNPEINKENSLLQHFMGWEIETSEPVFDNKVGTLMDFSVDQQHGATFIYLLPITEKLALIEYTLFTEEVLEMQQYKQALKAYVKKNVTFGDYKIVDDEFGIIPMSLQRFPRHLNEKIIHIGTAGGYTKASSGYTFQFVQKHTDKIVAKLKDGGSPLVNFTSREKMFQWYDRTLLDVILSKKLTGKEIFSTMFKKLAPEKILRFLGNESTIMEDLSIMASVPTLKFLTSAIKQL